jgi:hypothetical protein
MHPAVPHQLLRPTPDVTYSPVKSLLGLSNKNEKSTPVRTASTAKEVESATRVTALTDIPRGTCTEDIDVVDLTDENEAVPDNVSMVPVALNRRQLMAVVKSMETLCISYFLFN